MNRNSKDLTLTAMFLALGLVLPFLTGQIPQIGNMLVPMHIPVFLCGLICGWKYGAILGFILPILRNAVFGMPVLFPTGIAMAFELMTYGFICGAGFYLLNKYVKKIPTIASIYISLVSAMIIGRLIWGFFYFLFNFAVADAAPFTGIFFLTEAFANAWPGMIVQLVLIPAIVELLYSQKVLQNLLPDYARIFKKKGTENTNTENI